MHFLQLIDFQYLQNLPNFQYFQKVLYIAGGGTFSTSEAWPKGSSDPRLLIPRNEKPTYLLSPITHIMRYSA